MRRSATLYDRVAPHLFAIALRILRNKELAEDVRAREFRVLWERAAGLDAERGAAMSWLVDHRPPPRHRCPAPPGRAARRRPAAKTRWPVWLPAVTRRPTGAPAGTHLDRCLGQLEDQARRAVVYAYAYGYTHEELSQRLGAPLGTVKSWIRRSLDRLKLCLDAMRYADPRLRSILAGEYVLGTMKPRVRARFERLMRYDADLVRLTGEWADRLATADASARPEPVPPRIWRAIEARTTPAPQDPASQSWRSLGLWRWATAAASVAVLVLLVILGVQYETPAPHVVAVLADKDGTPGWIVSEARGQEAFAVEAVHAQAIDAQHAFELWVIADNKPRPLGVIPGVAQSRATIPASAVPKNGIAFAVSLEPSGGSPTGSPTGPVLYQGRIIEN